MAEVDGGEGRGRLEKGRRWRDLEKGREELYYLLDLGTCLQNFLLAVALRIEGMRFRATALKKKRPKFSWVVFPSLDFIIFQLELITWNIILC
jgi:hypothetical protein